jgi:hypothetical protein
MKRTLLIAAPLAVLGLTLAGCATTEPAKAPAAPAAAAPSPAVEEFNKLAAQAENEIKLANQAGFLWSKTEEFLKNAKEAAKASEEARKAGDAKKADDEMANATKLVKKAIKEAQLAQQQAKDQANPHVALDNFKVGSNK